MGNLASVEDLQKLMKRTFAGDDLDQADMVLTIVSSWARVVSGQSWPDAPASGVPADVTAVVLTATRRELKNPDRIISKTKGPFQVQYDKPPAGFFADAELEILRRFRRARGGLFTASTTRGEVRRRLPAFVYWNRAYGDATAGWETVVEWLDDPDCMDAGAAWVTGCDGSGD